MPTYHQKQPSVCTMNISRKTMPRMRKTLRLISNRSSISEMYLSSLNRRSRRSRRSRRRKRSRLRWLVFSKYREINSTGVDDGPSIQNHPKSRERGGSISNKRDKGTGERVGDGSDGGVAREGRTPKAQRKGVTKRRRRNGRE